MIATAALADENIARADHLLHSHIYGVELMQRRMYEISLRKGERVNGICTILDFEGLGFHHRQCLFVLKTLLDFDKKYYPEYLGKLYVINTPWVGPYLYQAVQVFLDEVTKARVSGSRIRSRAHRTCGAHVSVTNAPGASRASDLLCLLSPLPQIQIISDDPSAFLLTQISPENLPKLYGGNCTGAACKHGGMGDKFPGGLTGCVDVLDSSKIAAAGDASGLDAQEVSYDFEKEVQAAAEGDMFTWYFETANGYDVDFSVELLPVSGQREANENKRVYIQKVERLKSNKGSFKAPFANAKVRLCMRALAHRTIARARARAAVGMAVKTGC